MFSIAPDTLSLALGVSDMKYNQYIDNRLFTIQGVHKTKQNVYNSTTCKYDQVFSEKVFNLVNCTDDHVPDPQLREFFLKSQLYMHQCIPKDLLVEIEGQFNSDSYQELNFYFYKCTGQYCRDEKEINALVNNNYIELLFTDVYFVPENKDNPFVKYSRDLYWVTSQNLPKEVNIFMRNNYVESDFGWVTSDIKTQIYPSYSYSDNQIVDTSNGFFFHLVIRFEKEKENLYKRSYDNLFTIMSQIGGFSQILLTIFSFVCLRYSQIHLARSLINKSFEFQDVSNKTDQGILISNSTQCQNNIEIIQNQSQNKQMQTLFCPPSLKGSSFQLKSPSCDTCSPILAQDLKVSKIDFTKQNQHQEKTQQLCQKYTNNISKQLTDEEIMNDYNKQQEIVQNRSSLNFNIFTYMLSFVSRVFQSFKNKKQVIDYGIREIDNILDVEYIIKKLVEIDKLKRIIFNDDQLTLFNYIPKPQILYKFDATQRVIIEKNSFFNEDDKLNDFQKFKKVKQSFQNIFDKEKQTKIENRIMNLLDAKQQKILCNQLDKMQFKSQQQQNQHRISEKYIQNQCSQSRNELAYEKNSNLEEQTQENKLKSKYLQLQMKLNRYSNIKSVRNPNIYSQITNQDQQIYFLHKETIIYPKKQDINFEKSMKQKQNTYEGINITQITVTKTKLFYSSDELPSLRFLNPLINLIWLNYLDVFLEVFVQGRKTKCLFLLQIISMGTVQGVLRARLDQLQIIVNLINV
ncbi:hypothetical protein TTHERM_00313220 (macronuclear) [Tetrahymena thermophila SB210]|uniref:Uncharacterized protein n=1 Tax=Tetrahymena thermophila (strain SB210) TaxID=312017 RepID=Q22KF9_TETTS|nr:hypothetical protein TTHERM_00313220 [Tetrahymena thermophila SB210]EAR85840.2 hypothetical protein TTHERM_00313220 [Tetrahymena thermophila SB210]|eukprot:XP_001033503.2 hypothetical protein TTHERM_00313220 [Tetrahymena thermophila SB210]